MRLSVATVLSLVTSSLAVALVPRSLSTSLMTIDEPVAAGGGGGEGEGDAKAEGNMKDCKKFRIKSKGTAAGWVGQLESGQLRIGLKPVNLVMKSGEIVDGDKRGMWWTPPTDTLQCDVGQKPDKGWSVGCDGRMYFQDMSKYFQCEAENKTYNLYKKDGQAGKCGEIKLYMVGCGRGEDDGKGGDGGKGGGGGGSMPSPSNGTQTPQNGTKPHRLMA